MNQLNEPATAAIAVGDVMHQGVLTCGRDDSLLAVAELMARHRVHAIVVTDDADDPGALWGVVSDLDLAAAASVRDLAEQTAGAAAATAALTIRPGETLRRATQLMLEHGMTHLIVVDGHALRPVGVLSTLDVARALAQAARSC